MAEKTKSYLKYLQTWNEESKKEYNCCRNEAKRLSCKAHQEAWDHFISKMENDIHGKQVLAYKVMRQLNQKEKDTVQLEL